MPDKAQPGLAGRVNGLSRLRRIAIWLALGALAALGQAPWGLWPLTLLAFASLFALYRETKGVKQAIVLGLVAGTGYFLVALSWIVEPFLVDIARHGWIAPFALLGLSAGMGLYWALAFGLAAPLGRRALPLIVSFTLAEALRGWLFTGFPWAQLGHIWIDTPMLQWASIAGSLGLTALVLVLATALWHVLTGYRLGGVLGLAMIGVMFATGPLINAYGHTSPLERPVVRLIQPNAPQYQKWDPAMMPIFFERQREFTAAGEARPDLIVWPETAIPTLLDDAGDLFAVISQAAGDVPVVLGAQRLDGSRLYNSLAILDEGGQVTSVYDKHHLVPFGEYVPFGDTLKWFGISGMAARDGNGFSSGPGAEVIEIEGLGKALPLICYEGVFPGDVRSAPERPDFLLLITNDAWFGEVSGPYQHLAQARLRSVEQGLPMIRVANTGVSAMIDPNGRIAASLPLGQEGWMDATLPRPNPPTLYSRLGDLPVLACLLLVLGATQIFRLRS